MNMFGGLRGFRLFIVNCLKKKKKRKLIKEATKYNHSAQTIETYFTLRWKQNIPSRRRRDDHLIKQPWEEELGGDSVAEMPTVEKIKRKKKQQAYLEKATVSK